MQHVIKTYQSSSKRLLLFDYDGTLTPIRKTPNAAVPPPEMLKAMEVLVSDPKNYVFVISGRDQACLDNWLGHIKGLGLSAEVCVCVCVMDIFLTSLFILLVAWLLYQVPRSTRTAMEESTQRNGLELEE